MKKQMIGTALWLGRTRAAAGMARLLDRFPDGDRRTLRVLTWHRVLPDDRDPGTYPGVISATPDQFENQVRMLRKSYHPVSADEILDALHGNHSLPPRSVLLTFDDAYTDFAEHAWPVLKDNNVPVVLFVATAYPGDPERSFWWDRLYRSVVTTERRSPLTVATRQFPLETTEQRHATGMQLARHMHSLQHDEAMNLIAEICDTLDGQPSTGEVLDWSQLRALADDGVTLAAHTRTHPLLNRLSIDQARDEVVGSVEDLKQQIGDVPPLFAYPSGGVSAESAAMLRDVGIQAGFTTQRGLNDLRHVDTMQLRRINVGRRASEPILRLQLHGRMSATLAACGLL